MNKELSSNPDHLKQGCKNKYNCYITKERAEKINAVKLICNYLLNVELHK